MILTGKEVRADKAKKIGLVDLVVDPFALESVAINSARQVFVVFLSVFLFDVERI